MQRALKGRRASVHGDPCVYLSALTQEQLKNITGQQPGKKDTTMTINLIDSIRTNRTNTMATPLDCYGVNAKTYWTAFRDALYDWSLTDTAEDADKAFAAGKVLMGIINADLKGGHKVKFTGTDDLMRYRDAAVRFTNIDTDEAAKLKGVRSLCLYRLGESTSMSCTKALYDLALKVAEYKPTDAERMAYDLPHDIAGKLLATVDGMLADLKGDKTAKRKVKTPVGVECFRKSCEVLIAEKLDNVLSKTVEEINAERKAHNSEKNAVRKAAKQAKENASKAAAAKAA